MNRRRFTTSALAATALPLVARPARALERFNVGYSSIGLLYLPLFVGDKMGLFKQEGLDVTPTLFGAGGQSSMAGVLGGNIDAAVGASQEALSATANGGDARLVGAIMTEYASNVVIQGELAKKLGLTKDSSTAQRLAALKGLRLGGSPPGSGTDLLLRSMAKAAGLSTDTDVTFVSLSGSSAMLGAFKQRRIDGFAWSSPTSDTAVQKEGGFMLFDLNRGQYDPLAGYLYISVNTSGQVIEKRADALKRFLRGIRRAMEAMHDTPEKARDSVRPMFASYDQDIYDVAWADVLPAYPRSPAVTQAQVRRIEALMIETGRIKTEIPLEKWANLDLARNLGA